MQSYHPTRDVPLKFIQRFVSNKSIFLQQRGLDVFFWGGGRGFISRLFYLDNPFNFIFSNDII